MWAILFRPHFTNHVNIDCQAWEVYAISARSLSCLLMSWWHKEPGHQQVAYINKIHFIFCSPCGKDQHQSLHYNPFCVGNEVILTIVQTRLIPCLLMSWHLEALGHQQLWYWLYHIGRLFLYWLMMTLIMICKALKWYVLQINHNCIPSNQFST